MIDSQLKIHYKGKLFLGKNQTCVPYLYRKKDREGSDFAKEK